MLKKAHTSVLNRLKKDVKHREKPQVKMLRSTWHIIKMAFIKDECEEMKIEDTFRVKREDTEEQTEPMALKEENQKLYGEIQELEVISPAKNVERVSINIDTLKST
ncbi:gastrula zinc finger protein XlCGF8.2DB-like [Pimephales promelas]|nr:gastrula zinc finger protein XlCGF8.2DB-like [Pimephales promelas]